MFADAFLPNLLIFALGQIAAWGYVRTGLVVRGALLMVIGWGAGDTALVARFAFADTGAVYRSALVVMQVWSLAEVVLFARGRLRRRTKEHKAQRERLHREAISLYLRDDLDGALALHERAARRDPWDVEAAIAVATVHARAGRVRPAQRWFKRARAIDAKKSWSDVIEIELEQLANGAALKD